MLLIFLLKILTFSVTGQYIIPQFTWMVQRGPDDAMTAYYDIPLEVQSHTMWFVGICFTCWESDEKIDTSHVCVVNMKLQSLA